MPVCYRSRVRRRGPTAGVDRPSRGRFVSLSPRSGWPFLSWSSGANPRPDPRIGSTKPKKAAATLLEHYDLGIALVHSELVKRVFGCLLDCAAGCLHPLHC
jgi:hypothetical protein